MATQPATGPTHRILVLADTAGIAEGLLSALQSYGQVHITRTVEEAVAALRNEPFDLVLAGSTELLPLTRAAAHERAGRILEGIAQGACIVARDGRLIWANVALRQYPPAVADAIRQACVRVAGEWASAAPSPPAGHVRQEVVRVGPDFCCELSVSALPAASGGVEEVLGLCTDTTAMARMREKLDAVDSAGRELVALNADETALLEVGERLQLLEEKLIRYCRDLLRFTHFNVLVLDPKSARLQTVLAGGFSEAARNVEVYARETGNGISGYVAATGKSYICPDISRDPLYIPGFECAATSLTVPLRLIDRIVGVFNVESDQPAAFTEEDRQFAEIFARYIAVALHTLKLLAVERSEVAGQVAADVVSEVTEPLDGIVAEASRLMEEAPGSADARGRLGTIIERVDRVKRALQAAGRPAAIRGLVPEAVAADPILRDRRVLVADDEDIIRNTIADVLTRTGALVVTARDGDEAVAMIHSQSFDLVLSDIKMPYRSGYEVFAAARAVNKACPVILITGFGYDPDHSIVRASREGLAAVLFKPFKVEQLLANMHKALGAEPPKS
jgi:CheY-like chemotaxis protein/GAF domain-containing protein